MGLEENWVLCDRRFRSYGRLKVWELFGEAARVSRCVFRVFLEDDWCDECGDAVGVFLVVWEGFCTPHLLEFFERFPSNALLKASSRRFSFGGP